MKTSPAPNLTALDRPTAIYARLSLDRQDGAGIERQLADCRDLAAESGWAPVLEFIDPSISASRFSRKPRPAYEAMVAAAERGDVGRIVVYHLDRLYRQPRELEPIIDLADRGLVVADVAGGDWKLTTADGRYRARIDVAAAAKASDDASRRILRQKKQRRAQGKPHGGPRPFGWADLMTPDPVEAAAVREAIEGVVAGRTLYDLAVAWNAAGLKGAHGGAAPWDGHAVRRVLVSPRHAALVIDHGEVAVDAAGEPIPATWPAIVDRDTWERCCAVLRSRATGTGVPRRRSWLTALLVCGACGARLTASNAGRGRRIWRCWAGKGGCGRVSIGAAPLEAAVEDELIRYVEGPALAEALRTRDDDGVQEIRAQIADLGRRRLELVEAFAGGGSAQVLRAATDGLEAERRQLDAELGRRAATSPLEGYAGVVGALRAAWPSLTTDQRRSILVAGYGRVTVRQAARRGCRFDSSRIDCEAR